MNSRAHFDGQVFGRLKIKESYKIKANGRWKHLVECECGSLKVVAGDDMRRGRISSCGCLRKELKSTHGMTKSSEYHVWAAMVQRCTNTNDKAYKNYGGRGIFVCDDWLSFDSFILDMGIKPSAKLTLERVDNESGYSKLNCVWASREDQSINQRIRSDNKTGVRGVSYCNSKCKYVANIQVSGKRVHLGLFTELSKAIDARAKAEVKYLIKK